MFSPVLISLSNTSFFISVPLSPCLSLSDTLNTHVNSCLLCLSFYWIPVEWWKYNCHQSIYLSSAHTHRHTCRRTHTLKRTTSRHTQRCTYTQVHTMSHTCPAGNVVEIKKKDVRKTRGQPVSWEKSRCVCVCVFDYVCACRPNSHMCVSTGEHCALCEKVNPLWFHLSTWHIVWPLWSTKCARAPKHKHTHSVL